MKLTKKDITFIKNVVPGLGRDAYLEHSPYDHIVGWWHPTAEDIQGGKPVGDYVGVGNYLAVTSTQNTPGVETAIKENPGRILLAVLYQGGGATHLVAIASLQDYALKGSFVKDKSKFYRWAKVLGVRKDTNFRDVLTKHGVVLEETRMAFELEGGHYTRIDRDQLTHQEDHVREAIWHYFIGEAPAVYTSVVDPGDLLGIG